MSAPRRRNGSNLSRITSPWSQTREAENVEDTAAESQDEESQTGAGPQGSRQTRSRQTSDIFSLSSSHSGSTNWASQRQPARSFVQRSFFGPADPPESLQYSNQGVRRQTAELASIVLSDAAPSPTRQPSSFSYFPGPSQSAIAEDDTTADDDDVATPTIERTHFPLSFDRDLDTPEEGATQPGRPSVSTSASALTALLRRTPPQVPSEPMDNPRLLSLGRRSSDQVIGTSPPDTESSGLLQKWQHHENYGTTPDSPHEDVEAQVSPRRAWSWKMGQALGLRTLSSPRTLMERATRGKPVTRRDMLEAVVLHPISCVPAVILGTLLNILDALSYGLILFPLGNEIFANSGPDGLSMFYVATVVAQLTFTFGGSRFKGGVGSEMIEVVPFFHTMAFKIVHRMGKGNPHAVLSTTILSYAVSAVITGLIFGGLGAARLGNLVAFFPRHILTGCIGGVGWFLIATGVEVSARLDGNLDYNLRTLKKLFQTDTMPLWMLPILLALICRLVEPRLPERLRKYWMPVFFLIIPAVFYIVVSIHPGLNVQKLRDAGWIFAAPPGGMPWWHFYTLYDFKATDWGALLSTVPAMLALTFFGILHVPINIPALALTTGVDDIDLNHELIGHGVANIISGCIGSVQTYLVYSNSVIFIKTGGNSRTAGFMLAMATGGILLAGPDLVGFIPICMVGALIFYLGIELFLEGVYGPYKQVLWFEYLTILIIVATMGLYDFVWGIFVGIILACLSFVTRSARTSAIRASYDGTIARSTVRRHIVQRSYLDQVGRQIHVSKLAGFIFFGTIVDVEKQTRALLDEDVFSEKPIRFVIFDCSSVDGIDYSASEGLGRLQNMFSSREAHLILAGVNPYDGLGGQLRELHLWDKVRTYPNLNEALEACENDLLMTLHKRMEALRHEHERAKRLEIPKAPADQQMSARMSNAFVGSPRAEILQQAALSLDQHAVPPPKWTNYKQPLPLILQVFQDLTSLNEDQWFHACPYFHREEYQQGEVVFRRHESAKAFYLVESGILRADYDLPNGGYHEIIQQGTTCGELPFFSETERTATVVADEMCVVWALARKDWQDMCDKGDGSVEKQLAMEILKMALKLTKERLDVVTNYTLVTGG